TAFFHDLHKLANILSRRMSLFRMILNGGYRNWAGPGRWDFLQRDVIPPDRCVGSIAEIQLDSHASCLCGCGSFQSQAGPFPFNIDSVSIVGLTGPADGTPVMPRAKRLTRN